MKLKFILGKVWLVYAMGFFCLLFLAMYPLFWLTLQHKSTYRLASFLRKVWGYTTLIVGCMFPVVRYEEKLDPNQRYVFAPNHASYLDIITNGTLLPGFNFFMAKIELTKVPLFNIWFKTLDVSVKRESIRHAHRAFTEASEKMDELDANLVIYPEGRIPDYTPKLIYPFKPGAFRVAIEKQIPIVPVTMPDNHRLMNNFKWLAAPGLMRMIIHKPIPTKGLSNDDIPKLAEQVHEVINSQLERSGAFKNYPAWT